MIVDKEYYIVEYDNRHLIFDTYKEAKEFYDDKMTNCCDFIGHFITYEIYKVKCLDKCFEGSAI